jgi:predicted Rossmann fold nucleotide-binding protein DprA/Smf involved in DNA uptake
MRQVGPVRDHGWREAAALASLPGITPRRLRALLDDREPEEAWMLLRRGAHPADPQARLRPFATEQRLEAVAKRCVAVGASVFVLRSDPAASPRILPRSSAEADGSDGAEFTAPCAHSPAPPQSQRQGSTYPKRLAYDSGAPAVLFVRGDVSLLDRRPAVAVVGTRRATRYGEATAGRLGVALAEAGVVVVSGMAAGIDQAALGGALEASSAAPGVTGIAGTGMDGFGARRPEDGLGASDDLGVVIPKVQAAKPAPPVAVIGPPIDWNPSGETGRLLERIVSLGVVLSEGPPGVRTERWRFAARNRLMAALADMVVVVESGLDGGSWHTVRAAQARAVPLGAVPGPVTSVASAGPNELIAHGVVVVRGVGDVLQVLGRAQSDGRSASWPVVPGALAPGPGRRRSKRGMRAARAVEQATAALGDAAGHADPSVPVAGSPLEEAVMAALDWQPCLLDEVAERCGAPLAAVAVALERLRDRGLVEDTGGAWARR